MREDFTDIRIVLDRSGSMQSICETVIRSVNEFVIEQRKGPGDCVVSLYQFDDVFETVYSECPIRDAPMLNAEIYKPRNSTALLDAIGRTITLTGIRLANMYAADRPANVVLVIVTDGKENASVEFTQAQIFSMIKLQRDVYSWKFVFLAANQDAIEAGKTMGISEKHSMTYAHSARGMSVSAAAAGDLVRAFRAGNSNAAFSNTQRQDANP